MWHVCCAWTWEQRLGLWSRCPHSPSQTEECLHLFVVANLLGDQLIEDRAVILVDLLHLVDVAGHFLHGLQGLCGDQNGGVGEWGEGGGKEKHTMLKGVQTASPGSPVRW